MRIKNFFDLKKCFGSLLRHKSILLSALPIFLSVLALGISTYLFTNQIYLGSQEKLNQNTLGASITSEQKNLQDRLESLNNLVANLNTQQKSLENESELLKTQNDQLKNNAAACKKFVHAFFLFYEKASEMFANGISGCAVKYINSGNPNQLPDGCYRWESWKVKSGWDKYYEKWQQEPDQKYYSALKELYDQALQYQSSCQGK